MDELNVDRKNSTCIWPQSLGTMIHATNEIIFFFSKRRKIIWGHVFS